MLPGQVMVPGPLWVEPAFSDSPSSLHPSPFSRSSTLPVWGCHRLLMLCVCVGGWNGGRVGGWVKASCSGGTLRMGNPTLGEPR